MAYKRKGFRKKSRRPILLFILISILLHFLILLILTNNSQILLPKIKKAEKKDDSFIEISEIPVPEDKETEPPEKVKRYAERSRKVEKEKTVDDFTKQGAVSLPNTPTTAQRTSKPKQDVKKQEVAKKEKKTENNKKESIKTAAIPKYKKPDINLPNKKKENKEKKRLDDLNTKELFKTAQNPFFGQQANSPSFKGSRNVPKEDTVELNTTEYKYLSYFLKLKRQIEGVWNYPKASKINREQGELLLIFTLSSNGNLEDVKLLETSGYPRLDNEALRAIRVAAPYIPFPKAWDLERLNIKAGFIYRYGNWQYRR
jgi:protein TonB